MFDFEQTNFHLFLELILPLVELIVLNILYGHECVEFLFYERLVVFFELYYRHKLVGGMVAGQGGL